MKNIVFIIWLFPSLAHAFELFYVSEDPDLLEKAIIIRNEGKNYKLSARPYSGFVINKAIKVSKEGKFSVQLSGILLEKDWPIVSLAAKIENSWNLEIEKGEVSKRRAVLIVHGLNEKDADSLIAKINPGG
jgi:hypothetical protein